MPCFVRHSPKNFGTKQYLRASKATAGANFLLPFSSPSAGSQFTEASVVLAATGEPVEAGSRFTTAIVLFSSDCFATTID